MHITYTNEEKRYRPINKPAFWITRPIYYIWRKLKWWIFWKPINWVAEKLYQARRNRVVQTLMFLPIAAGYLSIALTFAHYQLGWSFPEIRAETVEEQKAVQEDRMRQALADITEADAKKAAALAVVEEVKNEIKALDDAQLKQELGFE